MLKFVPPSLLQMQNRERDGKTGKDFYMLIDWRIDTDKEVLALAKATRFREVRKIHFEYIGKEESNEVLEYLVSNCPDKLSIFAFDACTECYGYGDFYVKGIEKVSV